MADDFRARLRVGCRYRPEDQHGKRPLPHTIDLDTALVLALGDDDLRALLESPSSFDSLRQRQGEFIASELLPLLRRYHGDGKEVFAMLGNDDFAELESLLLGEERLGTLSYLHGRTCPLGARRCWATRACSVSRFATATGSGPRNKSAKTSRP